MSENYDYDRLPTVHETPMHDSRDQDITEYAAADLDPQVANINPAQARKAALRSHYYVHSIHSSLYVHFLSPIIAPLTKTTTPIGPA
jgi:hypothetical protein